MSARSGAQFVPIGMPTTMYLVENLSPEDHENAVD